MKSKRKILFKLYFYLFILSLSKGLSHELPIKEITSGYNTSSITEYNNEILYGPIIVNPYSFYLEDNIFIINAINHYDKTIYLAIT